MSPTPTEHAKELLRSVLEHPAYLYTWEAEGIDRYVFGGATEYPDFTARGINEAFDYTLRHPGSTAFPDAAMVHRLRQVDHQAPEHGRYVAGEPDRYRARQIAENHPFPDEEVTDVDEDP